jgi:hypothetical protein
MKIGIDCSYYNNYSSTQYDLLASGIDFAIVRTGFGLNVDKKASTHLSEFRKRQVQVSSYWWADPTVEVSSQARFIVSTTKKNILPSVYLDVEQFWSDWAAYMRGDYATAFATRFTPAQLETFYHRLYNEVIAGFFGAGTETGIYSADWVIDGYCPSLASWVYDKNYFEARYLRYYNPSGLASIYQKFGKPISIDKLSEFIQVAPIVRGSARQWESLVYVDKLYEHQDYVFITDEGYNKMFDMDVVVDPPVVVEPPAVNKAFLVNTLVLNIRSGAGVGYSKVGVYYKWTKVAILEVSGDWGRTDRGWISMALVVPIQGSYIVTAAWLNIREFASTSSKVIGGLKLGDVVYQISTSGVWFNIGKGWVSSTYLKPA